MTSTETSTGDHAAGRHAVGRHAAQPDSPWPALWAMVIGFFMILVDSTIVSIAIPSIIRSFEAEVNTVIWVTSAYLLAYAVPLLITGRLGDRFGPRRVYLVGLAIFTLSSLWCGLTSTVGMLIVARVVQGLGASLMTPQTMAVITRTFPAASRGKAMSLWGATAGVATLVGPLLGGVLVDGPGWEWIFFVNVPVGLIAFVLAMRLVPVLPTHTHRFDWVGVALSAVGMFLIVFGIQEGESYDWGPIVGPVTVPMMIGIGVVVMAVFVWWQSINRAEPLVPLSLFRERNFSLSNIAISTVGLAITAFAVPFMLYAQLVRGLSPTLAALLLVPMAIVSAMVAPLVGTLVDRVHPRLVTGFGFACGVVAFFWLSRLMHPDTPSWQLMIPMVMVGLATSFMFAPLAATATRNLPPASAGAGSGIYNTTRQLGAVIGSAAVAALIDSRLTAHLGAAAASGGSGGQASGTQIGTALPPAVREGFAAAMADTMLLPAGVLVIGLVVVLLLNRPGRD